MDTYKEKIVELATKMAAIENGMHHQTNGNFDFVRYMEASKTEIDARYELFKEGARLALLFNPAFHDGDLQDFLNGHAEEKGLKPTEV